LSPRPLIPLQQWYDCASPGDDPRATKQLAGFVTFPTRLARAGIFFALEEPMIRLCCAFTMLAIATSAIAQTPAPPYFIYRCTVVDGMAVKPGGALGRDQQDQDYGKRISPIVLDSETGQTKLGSIILESTYQIVSHGSMIESFQAYDPMGGVGTALIIRVDLPAPYRLFATFAGTSAYGGTCERTPKNAG
jgi:hypothetical protein